MTWILTPKPQKGTKAERYARERFLKSIRSLQDETIFDYTTQDLIPDAWAKIEEDIDCEEKKTKVTLLLDESVAKFYRAMGRGYQARVNRILVTYAQMKMARVRWAEQEMYRYEAEYRAEKAREAEAAAAAEAEEEGETPVIRRRYPPGEHRFEMDETALDPPEE